MIFSYYIISSHLYLYCFKCFFLIQVREVGLPGLMDPALIPVGMVPEQAPETAPLLTFLIAVQEAAPSLKHAKNAIAAVSMLCLALFQSSHGRALCRDNSVRHHDHHLILNT